VFLTDKPTFADSVAAELAFVMIVFCCSDILTPLPAFGVPFEIDDVKGPLIANPVRSLQQVFFGDLTRLMDLMVALSATVPCVQSLCKALEYAKALPVNYRCISYNQ